jgi:hypothetical protein
MTLKKWKQCRRKVGPTNHEFHYELFNAESYETIRYSVYKKDVTRSMHNNSNLYL